MFLKKLFNSLDGEYLIKSYIISAICTFLLWQIPDSHSIGFIIFSIINLILFPFATAIWDDLISIMTGGLVLILPLPILIGWKVFKILFLYALTILIAPIGMLYILLTSKIRQ